MHVIVQVKVIEINACYCSGKGTLLLPWIQPSFDDAASKFSVCSWVTLKGVTKILQQMGQSPSHWENQLFHKSFSLYSLNFYIRVTTNIFTGSQFNFIRLKTPCFEDKTVAFIVHHTKNNEYLYQLWHADPSKVEVDTKKLPILRRVPPVEAVVYP